MSGEVSARSSFERFLAVLCYSFSCLDVWYRKTQTQRGVFRRTGSTEVRIMFMQDDPDYVGENSWERNGERARQWQTFRGTEKQIRSSIIGALPSLSALTNSKRHGEYNFGKQQPFDGQGGLTYVAENGIIIVSGRFGEIIINGDGIDFQWEDLAWSFDVRGPGRVRGDIVITSKQLTASTLTVIRWPSH